MTKHVRTTYRSHRKATWAAALALVALTAAVLVPLANAGDKTYTMTVAPTSLCAPATNGGASTLVTLRNTGSPQTAGSAEVYFPPNSVHAVSSPWVLHSNTTSNSSGGSKDIVALDSLNLAPGQMKQITVSFKSSANFSTAITAALKQSNQFNDSSGSANLFTVQGGFPTLRVVQCVTVSGRVYQDRNLDNTYTTGSGAFLNSDVPKEWTVKLYGKDVGAPASSYALITQTTSGGPSSADPGKYTFTQVPGLRDYKVCVTAAGGDASSKWATQIPTGNADCAAISTGSPTSAANRLPNLSANALNQDFQVVPVVGPVGPTTSDTTVGGYTVDPSANSTKADDFYVQDTWVDSQGRTNFRFSPITACAPNCPPGKIYLLETLVADVDLSDLGGEQARLRYDDAAPFLDADLKSMPYCNIDPRQAGGNLATTGVLPGTDTSCIVEASQSVVAGGKVHAVYKVYTSYDGGRQIG
jgi:hypothetical protein